MLPAGKRNLPAMQGRVGRFLAFPMPHHPNHRRFLLLQMPFYEIEKECFRPLPTKPASDAPNHKSLA